MPSVLEYQPALLEEKGSFPEQAGSFPRFRYMGSKYRLLPWIHNTLRGLTFETALDAFSGSGAVSYLLKSMGCRVHANDALAFPSTLSAALIGNNSVHVSQNDLTRLMSSKAKTREEMFIRETFAGIFYTASELEFLDDLWCGVRMMSSPAKRALVLSAILRSAVKRQPRGLFTVAGDPERYKDGRRDLKLTLKEHFLEQIKIYNQAVFDNGERNIATHGDVFELPPGSDLVYLDPPYVPRSDDNCYIKRYHFLEGLACY